MPGKTVLCWYSSSITGVPGITLERRNMMMEQVSIQSRGSCTSLKGRELSPPSATIERHMVHGSEVCGLLWPEQSGNTPPARAVAATDSLEQESSTIELPLLRLFCLCCCCTNSFLLFIVHVEVRQKVTCAGPAPAIYCCCRWLYN